MAAWGITWMCACVVAGLVRGQPATYRYDYQIYSTDPDRLPQVVVTASDHTTSSSDGHRPRIVVGPNTKVVKETDPKTGKGRLRVTFTGPGEELSEFFKKLIPGGPEELNNPDRHFNKTDSSSSWQAEAYPNKIFETQKELTYKLDHFERVFQVEDRVRPAAVGAFGSQDGTRTTTKSQERQQLTPAPSLDAMNPNVQRYSGQKEAQPQSAYKHEGQPLLANDTNHTLHVQNLSPLLRSPQRQPDDRLQSKNESAMSSEFHVDSQVPKPNITLLNSASLPCASGYRKLGVVGECVKEVALGQSSSASTQSC